MADNWKVHLLSLLGFILLSLVMTFPVGFDAHNYLLAEHLDTTAALYNLWWFYQALVEMHTSPWFNPLINYPEGYSMVFYPIYFVYGLLSIPFQAILGTPEGIPAFFNFITVLSFILTGYFTFLLVRYLTYSSFGTARNSPAFISGLIFAFIPFRFWNISRCHVTCTEFLVLAVYLYLLAVEQKKRRHGIGLGVTLLLLVYSSPNYMIYLFIFILIHLGYLMARDRGLVLSIDFLKQAGIAGIIFIPLFLPLGLAVLRQLLEPSLAFVPPLKEQVEYSGNILGYLIPGSTQTLYRPLIHLLPAVDPDLSRSHGVGGYEIFPGYSVIALAAFTLIWWRPPRVWLWAITAILFFVLSLGPFLHVGKHDFLSFPLPHRWLSWFIPVFQVDRSPVRFIVMAELAIAIISGLGLASLLERFFQPWSRRVFLVGVGLLVCLEFFQAPLTLSAVPIPEFHQSLAKEPGDFSILDLPMLPDIYRYSGTYQTWHGKRLIIDLIGRQTDRSLFKDPLFFYLSEPLRWEVLSAGGKREAEAKLKAQIQRRRLRYVVMFTRFMEPDNIELTEKLLRRLGPEKEWDEGDIFIIFRFSVPKD
jgi:hypothetical protein